MRLFGNGLGSLFLRLLGYSGDMPSPENGDVWYNTVTGKARLKEGGAIKNVIVTGGGSVNLQTVEIDFTSASPGRAFDVEVLGVQAGQTVMASPSLDMPAGVQQDEFEADPFAVAASVLAPDTVRIIAVCLAGPITGKRNINLIIV
jgi:hypothetical protein